MYELVFKGNPILKEMASPVEDGEDVSELLDAMWPIMVENGGMGLAGNQVGCLKRVIIISKDDIKIECINPVITKRYGGKYKISEGCLSFPDEEYTKTRHAKVILQGYSREWKKIRIKLEGILAVCAQHEVDHLNGITIG